MPCAFNGWLSLSMAEKSGKAASALCAARREAKIIMLTNTISEAAAAQEAIGLPAMLWLIYWQIATWQIPLNVQAVWVRY